MNQKILQIVLAAVSVVALGALGAWYHGNESLRHARADLVNATLVPIAAALKENQALHRELQAEPFTEKDATSVLGAYLAKVRRDGVPKHADMKERLDAFAENNATIATLLKAYAPHARTPGFAAEADKFRNYASAWRDRWNSVMELFMAGGNFAAAGVPFPAGFPEAVQAEIAAAR